MPYGISKEIYGSVAIFASMFCFYLETAVVRWATTTQNMLNTPFLVFVRFLFGFIVVGLVFLVYRKPFRPQRMGLLIWRTVTNLMAVFFTYKAVELTTLAEGSILNMTYPIFIGIFSWIFLKHQRDLIALLMTIVAFTGIYLVLSPDEVRIEWVSLWGLSSGMVAAISLILLNLTRQENDTHTILLLVYGIGTVILFVAFQRHFYMPTRVELGYLLGGAVLALIGQYLLTMGFRYVTPVEGGVVSSGRILIAALMGPYITSDPPLTLTGWVGALLILGTNIYFIVRKTAAPAV